MLFEGGIKHPYKLMKKIIEDNSIPKVGGQIQFGENVNLDFKIKGVGKIDEISGKPSLQLRGVDLYDDEIFDYKTTLKPGTKFLVNFSEMK